VRNICPHYLSSISRRAACIEHFAELSAGSAEGGERGKKGRRKELGAKNLTPALSAPKVKHWGGKRVGGRILLS